jgi:hypothetical protein
VPLSALCLSAATTQIHTRRFAPNRVFAYHANQRSPTPVARSGACYQLSRFQARISPLGHQRCCARAQLQLARSRPATTAACPSTVRKRGDANLRRLRFAPGDAQSFVSEWTESGFYRRRGRRWLLCLCRVLCEQLERRGERRASTLEWRCLSGQQHDTLPRHGALCPVLLCAGQPLV